MSDEHNHPAEDHSHGTAPAGTGAAPEGALAEDAGSRALSEALRSSFFIVQVVMVILVVVFLGSGFFTVDAQHRKVILRFGRTVGSGNAALLGPGWHWAFPPPIDEVVTIPYAQSLTVISTVGWYHLSPTEAIDEATAGIKPRGRDTLDPLVDGYTMVGDGNIIHTRASLSYRVEDPIRYAFDFVNASNAVQTALDNALIYASAKYTNVDDVLVRDKTGFQDAVRARVNDLVNQEGLGIAIEQCQVDEVPPLILAADFENVTSATAKAVTDLNNALGYQFKVTNNAATVAARIISTAETDRLQMITNLVADVKLFNDLLPMYKTNAALVERTYLAPVVGQIMNNAGWKWYVTALPGGQKTPIIIQTGPDFRAPKPPAPLNDLENRLD